jgi:thioredoxin 1
MSYQTYNELGKSRQERQQAPQAQAQAPQAQAPQAPQAQAPQAPSVNSIEEKKQKIWSNEICIFKISTEWCKPCKIISPLYDRLASEVNNPGKIMLFAEDADKKLSANVTGVPAFDFYFRGQKVHRQSGADFNQFKANVKMMTQAALSSNGEPKPNLEPVSNPAAGMQSRNMGNQRPSINGKLFS